MSKLTPPAISEMRFTAKIDYLSIENIVRAELPPTEGHVVWPTSCKSTRLTIHDPTPGDLLALISRFPNGVLFELEVAVDLRVARRLPADENRAALALIKSEHVAKGLRPEFAPGLNNGFRGAYRKTDKGYSLTPFNRRVPLPEEQLLYGHRNDGAQVKVYFKGSDNNNTLPNHEQSIRIEVRLGKVGLRSHNLDTPVDLIGFQFRSELMPYFQHVHGSRPRGSHCKKSDANQRLTSQTSKQVVADSVFWEKVGVGAFERGGKRAANDHLFSRNVAMNERFGQALHRLQRSFAAKEFVRERPYAAA